MADVQVSDLLAAYETEIGRLNGEVIKLRIGLQAVQSEAEALRNQLATSDESEGTP